MRAGRVVAVMACGLLVGACAGRAGSNAGPVPASCSLDAVMLEEGTSMTGFQGSYALELIGNDGRVVSGPLHLSERPAEMQAQGEWGTPLAGTLEVELAEIGAQRVGDISSDDPDAPGVLVLEGAGADGWSILLRLGSDANRTDITPIDAAYTVLSVQRLYEDGFTGVWWSGVRDARTEGFFCARSEG